MRSNFESIDLFGVEPNKRNRKSKPEDNGMVRVHRDVGTFAPGLTGS
jgi:hypothetical protein